MIPHLAVATVSAGILAYEVLLVRLLAIVEWHHFAFMVISIALLGFGASGTYLSLVRERLSGRKQKAFAANAVLFGLLAPIGFVFAQSLPFDSLEIFWRPGQLLYMPVLYLALGIPFFCGANCVALALMRDAQSIGRVYRYNLLGSGLGALGIVTLLLALSPVEALRVVLAAGLLAAALTYVFVPGRGRWWACAGPRRPTCRAGLPQALPSRR